MPGVPPRVLSLRVDPSGRLVVGTELGLYVEEAPGRFVPEPEWPGGPALALWVDGSGA